jgi:Tol biopolymer transport system component
LTNLTDDGVTGNFIKEGVEPLLDVAPAWSPDGKTLAFVRSARTADGWEGTALYRISASGGRPEKLLSVSDEEPLTVWLGLRWSSDGKKVFYAVAGSESDDPDNGIWMVDKDGKNPQHLLGVTDPEMGPPLLIDVSAQGDKALIWYWQAAAMAVASPINVSLLELIDLETGVVEPLKQATGDEEIEFFSPRNAIFSPDGSKILYAYSDASDGTRLVVRDLEDETEHVLLTHDVTLGAHFETGLGLDWADDDSIYVSTFKTGLLLSLGTE